jgi:hypothetical protein
MHSARNCCEFRVGVTMETSGAGALTDFTITRG